MKKLLTVQAFNFSYDDENEILKDVKLFVYPGTINGIIGANDSGKTTLIKILSGNMVYSDNIKLDGIKLDEKGEEDYLKNSEVVFLNTSRKLMFDKVKSLLQYQTRNNGYSFSETRKRLSDMSELFGIKDILNKKISKLNPLDRARALLVAGIIKNPKILFIDDLFQDLSFDESIIIFDMLDTISKKEGIAVVFTTSKLDTCINCDSIYFLNEGSLDYYKDFNSIIKHDNLLTRKGIVLPTMLDLSLKLKDYNILDEIIYTPDRMVDVLWKE